MDFWTWVIIIVVGAVVVAVIQAINTSNKKKAMDDHLGGIKDFSTTQKVIGSDGNTGLAIDEQRKKICLIDHRQQNVTTRVFVYKNLLSSEIFEDGATVTKTVRSSQLGGALIGGLALGGVGAIIGGLSGKTQTSGKIKKIDLRLTVNDTTNPLHDINFLDLETKKDGFIYKQAIQQARHWHGLIEVLIKRADLEDKAASTNDAPKLPSGSVADELKKLAELRDAGVLSIEEFQQQKARLLSA
ncbi:SHOCT domain-containing protein [Simplicispira lacusdiani]|uniref:SHOCT domain-containing protein n=1 Tax=Simplicispira lacusdiani TaxID=2213010 RepID=UPI000E735543|nr:SHOCT domain-containing protein [Simplicispira lacusdiani]